MREGRSSANVWVVVRVRGQEFAFQAAQVQEILRMPATTAIPLGRPQDRGVINLRGRILPLIDMRKLFGWKTIPEELDDFYALMNQREEDHRKWLTELERSAVEGTEFRLATDPHKCAFGRWYYSYQSGSPWITALLGMFEAPHARIHGIASSIGELTRAGKKEEACLLIERSRNAELQQMISLFKQLKDLMRETVKELAMVIVGPRRTFAVAIDHAVAVETIPPDLIKGVQTDVLAHGSGLIHRVAERTAAKSLAMILEPEMFMGR